MTKKELKKISLQFRTLSSQMLRIESEEETGFIQAFYDFVTETPLIHDYIVSCHKNDYDFDAILNSSYYSPLELPARQEDLIDYEYQLLTYLLSGKGLRAFVFHYSSSKKYSDLISAFMKKGIQPFVVALRSFLEISMIDMEDENMISSEPEQKTIFLSYCQKDSKFADLIEKRLNVLIQSNAKITRDIRDVPFHESFGRFMQTIQDHDYVLLLISDHYLKSRNCMFEVTEAIKDTRYDKKIIFIVLKDNDKELLESPCEDPIEPDIYSSNGQTQYILYWRNKAEELQSRIDEIGDPTYAISQIKEKKIVQKILLDLPDFFEFVRDINGLSLTMHLSEDYKSILSFMGLQA